MTAGGSAALWRCQQGDKPKSKQWLKMAVSMASAGTYQAIAVDGGGALDRVSHWTASHWYWILLDTSGTFKIPMDEWHPRDSGCRWNGHSVASFSSQGSRKQPILWYHMGVAGEKCCVRWTSNSSSTSHNPCPHELPQIATGDHLRQVLQPTASPHITPWPAALSAWNPPIRASTVWETTRSRIIGSHDFDMQWFMDVNMNGK